MIPLLRKSFVMITTLFAIVSSAALAQEHRIAITVLDGKSGKPIANENLIVNLGNTADDVRFKPQVVNLQTDNKGEAALDAKLFSFARVWVDHHTTCQNRPNSAAALSVADITQHGLSTPNNCGRVAKPNRPGMLVVFARKSTLRERMAR